MSNSVVVISTGLPVAPDLAGAGHQPDAVDLERLGGARRGPARAPQHGTDPRDQLLGLERLGQVVVGTGVQPGDPIRPRRPRREHDDRHRAPPADLAQHLEALQARAASRPAGSGRARPPGREQGPAGRRGPPPPPCPAPRRTRASGRTTPRRHRSTGPRHPAPAWLSLVSVLIRLAFSSQERDRHPVNLRRVFVRGRTGSSVRPRHARVRPKDVSAIRPSPGRRILQCSGCRTSRPAPCPTATGDHHRAFGSDQALSRPDWTIIGPLRIRPSPGRR